jgi:hypothetical protein
MSKAFCIIFTDYPQAIRLGYDAFQQGLWLRNTLKCKLKNTLSTEYVMPNNNNNKFNL